MVKLSLQRVLQQHLAGFLARHALPLYQIKALEQWTDCRTAALGGHAQYCGNGHFNGVWYNSCRHRSCPQCRGKATEEWLRNTQRVLLDCPHHHVVFTLPHELHGLWRYNRTVINDCLFNAAQQTLKTFAQDPQYLGAMPGILCTLHTWGRDLALHPHVHVLISHGGVDEQGRWVEPRKTVLFPQKPVMQVFRGKFLALLREAMAGGAHWQLPPDRRPPQVQSLLNKLGRRDWVVHWCERYDYADGVAKYLSRYVKSGPLRNSQLLAVTGTTVQFRYPSHRTGRREILTLSIDDFLLRLLQHVPTPGKPGVRYSGLYSSAGRPRLNQARAALGQSAVSPRQLLDWQDYLEGLEAPPACAVCGLPLSHQQAVPRDRAAA